MKCRGIPITSDGVIRIRGKYASLLFWIQRTVRNLLSVICCPVCKRDLVLRSRILLPDGRAKSGVLFCQACDDIAGVVRNFKFDFLHYDRAAVARRLDTPDSELPGVTDEVIPFDDPRIRRIGQWESLEGKYLLNHGTPGDSIEFEGEFLDLGVRLLTHPWSGIAEILLDGEAVREIDLYQPQWSTVTWFPLANDLPLGPHRLEIRVTGRKNPAAESTQVLLHEIVLTRISETASVQQPREDLNRVLPVSPEALELINQVPEDGLILDCGGGDRTFADPRYVNLEYQQYQLPQVYGDAHNLPFRSDSFDLVFSQAMLEHVQNPFRAVEEMGRVAKPGGKVWAGMAFLQPIHAVPSHYFNATVWGAEELFRNLEILDSSWFGELSFTVEWLMKTARIPEKVPADEYDELLRRIKRLDPLIDYDRLRDVASGVAILARKPA
jgi:SAM-dependent methyltransferase